MSCKVTHCAGCISANTRPHQLHWGDRKMVTGISCTEYSEVAGLIQKVCRSSSEASCSCLSFEDHSNRICHVFINVHANINACVCIHIFCLCTCRWHGFISGGQSWGVCLVQLCAKYRLEGAISCPYHPYPKIKKAVSLKVKGLLCSCLLIMCLPSGSRMLDWHLETIYYAWCLQCSSCDCSGTSGRSDSLIVHDNMCCQFDSVFIQINQCHTRITFLCLQFLSHSTFPYSLWLVTRSHSRGEGLLTFVQCPWVSAQEISTANHIMKNITVELADQGIHQPLSSVWGLERKLFSPSFLPPSLLPSFPLFPLLLSFFLHPYM